jgi:hypothetical protein
VVLGKLVHYGLLLAVPWALHGPGAALTGLIAYSITQSVVLSATFAVSHNVPETKPLDASATQDELLKELAERDWAVQQVLTSANWGGAIGNFFTGGCGSAAGVGHVYGEGKEVSSGLLAGSWLVQHGCGPPICAAGHVGCPSRKCGLGHVLSA